MREADLQAEEVMISAKGVLVGVAFTCLGVLLTVFGPYVASALWPRENESRTPGHAMGVGIALLAFITYLGVESYIQSLGYRLEPFWK